MLACIDYAALNMRIVRGKFMDAYIYSRTLKESWDKMKRGIILLT